VSDPVAVAIISSIGLIVSGALGVWLESIRRSVKKTKSDAESAAKHASDIYGSINNRDESLSDRIDKLATAQDVQALARSVTALTETTAALTVAQTNDRQAFNNHLREAAKLTPMLEVLYRQYGRKEGPNAH
jgi:phage-related protein